MSEKLPFSDAPQLYTAEQMQNWGQAFAGLSPSFEFSHGTERYSAEQLAAMRAESTPHPRFTHPEVDVPLEEVSTDNPAIEFSHTENHKTSTTNPSAGVTEITFDDGNQKS